MVRCLFRTMVKSKFYCLISNTVVVVGSSANGHRITSHQETRDHIHGTYVRPSWLAVNLHGVFKMVSIALAFSMVV